MMECNEFIEKQIHELSVLIEEDFELFVNRVKCCIQRQTAEDSDIHGDRTVTANKYVKQAHGSDIPDLALAPIKNILEAKCHQAFISKIAKEIARQYCDLMKGSEDKEGSGIHSLKDSSQVLLQNEGSGLLRFDWRVIFGIPNKGKRIFGLYYAISQISEENNGPFFQEQLKLCLFTSEKGVSCQETQNQQISELIQNYYFQRKERHFLNQIGVFEVHNGQKIVDYGVGLYRYPNIFITLSKYFKQGNKPGKAYFKNLERNMHPPLKNYDISSTKILELFGKDDEFAKLKLIDNPRRLQNSQLVYSRDEADFDYYNGKGFGVSVKDKIVTISSFPFDKNSLDQFEAFPVALVFADQNSHEDQQGVNHFYGFYDNLSRNNPTEDNYVRLFKETLLKPQNSMARTQAFVIGHHRQEPDSPWSRHPFSSIGIIEIEQGGKGTAQMLYSKSQKCCRFLITCAHNFLNLLEDNTKLYKLKKYTFSLPRQNKQKGYVMERVSDFNIKQLSIPKEYKDEISKIKKRRGVEKTVVFSNGKNLTSEPSIHIVDAQQLYDIAIVELQNPIYVKQGFVINGIEKPFANIDKRKIELAGFPADQSHGTVVGRMYYETTEHHDASYVQIAQENRMLGHKLSTLQGNSGSALYERISEDKCYLFGIHISHSTSNEGETLNLASYLYSKPIHDWWKAIPGIDSVVQKI